MNRLKEAADTGKSAGWLDARSLGEKLVDIENQDEARKRLERVGSDTDYRRKTEAVTSFYANMRKRITKDINDGVYPLAYAAGYDGETDHTPELTEALGKDVWRQLHGLDFQHLMGNFRKWGMDQGLWIRTEFPHNGDWRWIRFDVQPKSSLKRGRVL